MLKLNRFDKLTNRLAKSPMFWPAIITLYLIALAVFSYAFLRWL